MLALTDEAVETVKAIVEARETPETGGLRLAAERSGDRTTLHLSVVVLPGEDDEIIEEGGARVFLELEAAALLDDKVLDVTVQRDRVEFTIADQFEV